MPKAVVLLSGGLDSTTTLAIPKSPSNEIFIDLVLLNCFLTIKCKLLNDERIKLKMSIEDRVRKVVSEQLDVSADIDNNASFIDDLGADSLDTVELVMSLEEEFDCEIADDEAENITTIQQAIDYINANT